jgi:hypothetical protein
VVYVELNFKQTDETTTFIELLGYLEHTGGL